VSLRRSQSESRMPEIGTSGLMSGDGKRGGGNVSTRAHPRLYPAAELLLGAARNKPIPKRTKFSASGPNTKWHCPLVRACLEKLSK